jgi:hypothetical protein
MIRRGINQKNFEYWRDEIFIRTQHDTLLADLKAHRVCHEQEIKMLKDRIIKLEKKFKQHEDNPRKI